MISSSCHCTRISGWWFSQWIYYLPAPITTISRLEKPHGLFQPFRPSALWSAQLAFFDFSCFSSPSRLDTGIRSRLRSGPDCATTCQDQPRITSGVGLSLLELAGKLEPAGRLERRRAKPISRGRRRLIVRADWGRLLVALYL